MFLFFLTLIPFNFLVRDCWWTVHGVHICVCSVTFCNILDDKPNFLVFLLILNCIGFSLVGFFIDLKVHA